MNKIGEHIKELRKSKGVTLLELSEITELSTGFLSKLERNLNSPTIINLQKICKALDINMTDLIADLEEDSVVVRKAERKVIFESDSNIRYEMTSDGNKKMRGVCMIVDDNSIVNQSFKHNTDEFGIIFKGSLEMTINDTAYELFEGDSIYIKAENPHSFKKLGEGECISYWTYIEN